MRPNIGHTSKKTTSANATKHINQALRRRKFLRVRERRGHEFESTSEIV
jgi:hypothetical protein